MTLDELIEQARKSSDFHPETEKYLRGLFTTRKAKIAGARCPNHDVPLIKTDDPGKGICPISGAIFDYDEETDEILRKYEIKMVNGQPTYVEVPIVETSSNV